MKASPRELMEQAGPTVETYLEGMIAALDCKFGKDFAKKHPELLGTLVKACVEDFDTAIRAQGAGEFSSAINRIADALDSFATHMEERNMIEHDKMKTRKSK